MPLLELIKSIKLKLINSEIAGIISYAVKTILFFRDYLKELYYLVTSLIKFDIILEMSWLELHDPHISFKERSYIFNLDYYITECLKYHRPVIIYSPGYKGLFLSSITKYRDIVEILAYAFIKLAEKREN